MTPAQFRKLATAWPAVKEGAHQGHLDFRCGGKIVATLGAPDDQWAVVRLTPEQQRQFRLMAPECFRPARGNWGQRGYTQVLLSQANPQVVRLALQCAIDPLQPREHLSGTRIQSLSPPKARKQTKPFSTHTDTSGREATRRSRISSLLAALKAKGSQKQVTGLARFGIRPAKAFGIAMPELHRFARDLDRDHEIALALWDTEIYEARILSALVDDPAQVTSQQMDRQAKQFDNWAICDAFCWHLYDRTHHAWKKINSWSQRQPEFVRRAAFALLASLAVHDKTLGDDLFIQALELIEEAANDDRPFVKKSVNWALRAIGKRNRTLHPRGLAVAERLAESAIPAARWIGNDAVRELNSLGVIQRISRKP